MNRESLAEYVRRVRHAKGLSLLDVQRQSSRSGNHIAGSYVSRIENGLSVNPSKDKLIALARGLELPAEEVLAIAVGRPHKGEADPKEGKLLFFFRELSSDRQEDLLRIARALHKGETEKSNFTRGRDRKKK